MSLTLKIVSHNRRGLGAKASMTFGQDGGTIGRSLQNDWPLPDRKKYLSARHASIDFRSGTYYIVDTSKNGVYINGEDEPVGRAKPQRLFEGDVIRIGEYEMTVAIESADDTRETLIASSHIDPVDLKQRVEAPDPTSYDLVEVDAMAGEEFEISLAEDSSAQLPTHEADRAPAVAAPVSQQPASQVPEAAEGPAVGAGGALDEFFRGAGIEGPALTDEAGARVMLQIGQIMRELVSGLIDTTQLRSVQKAQLGPSAVNNDAGSEDGAQLSFTSDVQDCLERLLAFGVNALPEPAEAVRKTFAELRTHQRALLASNRHALNQYLTQLDPETIEDSVSKVKRGSFLNAAQKFRYWDVYRDVYTVLGNRVADEWPEPYQTALAEAYAKLTVPVAEEPAEIEVREAG